MCSSVMESEEGADSMKCLLREIRIHTEMGESLTFSDNTGFTVQV